VHGHGLRYGYPISPLFFNLAYDPLEHLIYLATNSHWLLPLLGIYTKLQISMYANDAVVFVGLVKEDIQTVAEIMDNFGHVTGMRSNIAKSSVAPIHSH
jgi:hypothetical protein